MEKKLFGVPVVIIAFLGAILLPLLGADYILYKGQKPVIVTRTVVKNVVVTPTASPSATLVPTRSFLRVVVTPTGTRGITVSPTVSK